MWSLLLIGFNTLSSPAFLPRDTGSLAAQPTKTNYVNSYTSRRVSFDVAQNLPLSNLVEAVSSSGFLLKYSPSWQRYTTQTSNPTSDILLARSFASPKGDIVVKVTTTVISLLGVPKNLPKTVKKINISADFFARALAQSGYKIYETTAIMIHEKPGIRLVAETPQKLGSTIVLLEGKDEKMIVSTSIYPIDNSIISREILEQVVAEIGLIQNSITVSK